MGVTKLLGLNGFRAAKALRKLWRERRPDIVQAYFLDASYFAIPIARSLRVPKIVRVRNNLGYWLTRKHRMMNRIVRGWVDVSLTNSEIGRETLIEKDGLAPDRVLPSRMASISNDSRTSIRRDSRERFELVASRTSEPSRMSMV